jgi:hypothetical protein
MKILWSVVYSENETTFVLLVNLTFYDHNFQKRIQRLSGVTRLVVSAMRTALGP